MIVTFYGTAAELIKMYGIISRVPRRDQILICTAQQYAGLQKVHAQLGIEPDLYLGRGFRGRDVASMAQVLALMLGVHGRFALKARALRRRLRAEDRREGTKSMALIHGDTLSTVVGGYLGRALGLHVGHVEAGLRSGSWRSPFPEELDRRAAAKIARTHFAPNERAVANLVAEHVKGEIVSTEFNTAKDAIERAVDFVSDHVAELELPDHYLLVLLHRTELIENREDFGEILRAIREYADRGHDVVFTSHSTTAEKITSLGLGELLEHPRIRVIPKQAYFDFMAIVQGADAIVTDGGGLQEDAYFLGIPTLVHRRRTEREEGLGTNAVLSGLDMTVVREWLANPPDTRALAAVRHDVSPSQIVVDYLREHRVIPR